LLGDPAAARVDAKWRVFAVISEAQPDRLRRVETWLCRQGGSDGNSYYAVLIDFVPISSGAATGGYLPPALRSHVWMMRVGARTDGRRGRILTLLDPVRAWSR
jgi:hypothetical protein